VGPEKLRVWAGESPPPRPSTRESAPPCVPARVGELREKSGWGRSRRGGFAANVPTRSLARLSLTRVAGGLGGGSRAPGPAGAAGAPSPRASPPEVLPACPSPGWQGDWAGAPGRLGWGAGPPHPRPPFNSVTRRRSAPPHTRPATSRTPPPAPRP